MLIENKGRLYNLDAVKWIEEFTDLPEPAEISGPAAWTQVMIPSPGFRLFFGGTVIVGNSRLRLSRPPWVSRRPSDETCAETVLDHKPERWAGAPPCE